MVREKKYDEITKNKVLSGKQYERRPYLGKSMPKNQEYQVKWEPEFYYLVDTPPIDYRH